MFEAVGTTRSKVTTTLSSKVLGNVVSVLAREGDRVRTGQLLAKIDSRDAQAEIARAKAGMLEAEAAAEEVERAFLATESGLEAAKANADLAKSTYQRFQELLKRKSVSQQEFDEVQANYTAATAEVKRAEETLRSFEAKKAQVKARQQQAEAALASAELLLSYSNITSPLHGLITEKSVEVGQLAAPGVPLFTVEDGRSYRLEATVEASRIRNISIGQTLAVKIDSLSEELEGKVTEIVPAADPASRSFTVKADLPAQPQLRSGLFGRLMFPAEVRESLLVPASAVVLRGQLEGLYVVDEEQRARFRLIRTGKQTGERIEVLSGVSEGETIVATPGDQLRDGIRLEIIETVARSRFLRKTPVGFSPRPVLDRTHLIARDVPESDKVPARMEAKA
jgi:multidrug resistance efflux pump